MKRRDTFRFIPLTLAGIAGTGPAFAAPKFRKSGIYPNAPLADRYLDKVRGIISHIKMTQTENMLEAGYLIARAVHNGHTCWYSWDCGHSVNADIFPGRVAVPDLVTVGYDPKKARRGDVMLASIWNGVNAFIEGLGFEEGDREKTEPMTPADVKKQGVTIIGAPAPWGMDAAGDEDIVFDSAKFRIRPSAEIWIETGATKLGAVMDFPGAGAPIGPVSGIVGMVTYWMMAADACRVLARDGKVLPVDGDEPSMSDDVPHVSLNAPLMDDYYTEFIRQHKMIDAEMGYIREAADMAVDAVLSGGKVWCYSRDRNSLAYESQTRRGGLALTRGLYEDKGELSVFGKPFEGSDRDVVIMGLDRPDHPADLQHLDEFRKHGCRIVTIGPSTRNLKTPEGRTAPGEADIHLGRMCDTYGLFALPGYKRSICPTSGAMLNQLFWATCLDIAEKIVERTGNVPGVYLTGAVTGGIDHLNRINDIYEQRGY